MEETLVTDEVLGLSRELLEKVYSSQAVEQALSILVRGRSEETERFRCRQAELRRKADFDELTGIYNRSTFYKKVVELFKLYPKDNFVIIRLNVERFKLINDLFGEETGDRLLRYIAEKLASAQFAYSTYGRMHSDNFVICFPLRGSNQMEFIREMQHDMEQALPSYKVAMTFGIYYVNNKNISVSTMCDRAGLALQQIKGNYMKSYNVYDERMRRAILQEQDIVNEMNSALSGGQFRVYLQPKYDIVTEQIVGAEALARWIHPEKGLISPAVFIPAFERNGFIMELDIYIWEIVCRLLRKWIDAGYDPQPISVNVSRLDLYRTDLCDVLNNMVKKYNLDPALLQLELTESAYTENPQQIIEVTKQLQKMGFPILMDDFGSGYSSLNMLKDISVDVLKIDLHFLDSQDESGRGGNILNSVVRMAEWLKIPVIAEGVETKQQADFMRDIGCYCVQGYYYSKPIGVEEYEALMNSI